MAKKNDRILDQNDRLRLMYELVFSSEEGKAVLSDILIKAGVFHFGMSPNPQALAVFEGRRALALEILMNAGQYGNYTNPTATFSSGPTSSSSSSDSDTESTGGGEFVGCPPEWSGKPDF